MDNNRYNKIKLFGNLTTPFKGQTRSEPVHNGIDIANKEGTPIPALADGQVMAVGATTNGLGNVVKLKDKNGDVHMYSHLAKAAVVPGQIVKRRQRLALMGHTGNSYSESGGPSDHVDIRIQGKDGQSKDPTKYLS